jgi:hypothetical protein
MAEASARGEDECPERRATNALAMDMQVRMLAAVAGWADDAQKEIGTWPRRRSGGRDTAVGPVERGTELFAGAARRASAATGG